MIEDMKHLLIIFSLFEASAFCVTQEDDNLENIPCLNSRLVVEERPDLTYIRIIADSGEKLLEMNSRTTNYSDFTSLIEELNLLLFPEEGQYLIGNSSDYYITIDQCEIEHDIKIENRQGYILFRKALPHQPGLVPSSKRCSHIYGFDLVIDPAFDITKPDGYNISALFWGSFFGLGDTVRSLVERGADVNQKSYLGVPPIVPAIVSDQQALVEFLIQKGASISVELGPNSMGVLHLAAFKGRTNISRILIQHGSDVNEADNKEHATPLHVALGMGHCNTAELLISNGANVNAVTNDGKTPLHLAVVSNTGCIHRLLAAGANINARDNDGNTPLIAALNNLESEAVMVVQHLLTQHNPDINIRNNKGETALDIANKRRFRNVVELLKSKSPA